MWQTREADGAQTTHEVTGNTEATRCTASVVGSHNHRAGVSSAPCECYRNQCLLLPSSSDNKFTTRTSFSYFALHFINMAVKCVAVIGLGPSGAITIDALAREKVFDTIRVFERREAPGGCW